LPLSAFAASVRRPRSVHRPLERERVEQRDRVLAALSLSLYK
jgi:hypothetical protein